MRRPVGRTCKSSSREVSFLKVPVLRRGRQRPLFSLRYAMHPCRFPHSYPYFDPLAPLILPAPDAKIYASLAHAYICLLHARRPALHSWLLIRGCEHPLFYDTQMGIVHALKQVQDPTPFSGQEVISAKQRATAFDAAFCLWFDFCQRTYPQFDESRHDAPFSFHKSIPSWMAARLNAKLMGNPVSSPRNVMGDVGFRRLRHMCAQISPRRTTSS